MPEFLTKEEIFKELLITKYIRPYKEGFVFTNTTFGIDFNAVFCPKYSVKAEETDNYDIIIKDLTDKDPRKINESLLFFPHDDVEHPNSYELRIENIGDDGKKLQICLIKDKEHWKEFISKINLIINA